MNGHAYNLSEEINRKAVESLSDLYARYYHQKSITLGMYLTGLLVFNNSLRGLVSEDLIQTVDEEYNTLQPVYFNSDEYRALMPIEDSVGRSISGGN